MEKEKYGQLIKGMIEVQDSVHNTMHDGGGSHSILQRCKTNVQDIGINVHGKKKVQDNAARERRKTYG